MSDVNPFDLDIDEDGVNETSVYDADGDGVVDAVFTDTDGDGFVDLVITEVDGDVTLTADLDGDGVADLLAQDTDGDGVVDYHSYDLDGAGRDGGVSTVFPPGGPTDIGGPPPVPHVGGPGEAAPPVRAPGPGHVEDLDLDGDGRKETRVYDHDGDGAPDEVTMDRNGDGRVDMTVVDRGTDGVQVTADQDFDGTWDYSGTDTDLDGRIDAHEGGPRGTRPAQPGDPATDLGPDPVAGIDAPGGGPIPGNVVERDVDLDGDGRAETRVYDSDGDGRIDAAASDIDGDGRVDVRVVQRDDGTVETHRDTDGDGTFDEVTWDGGDPAETIDAGQSPPGGAGPPAADVSPDDFPDINDVIASDTDDAVEVRSPTLAEDLHYDVDTDGDGVADTTLVDQGGDGTIDWARRDGEQSRVTENADGTVTIDRDPDADGVWDND